MNELPNQIYSGVYREGHVQGIAVDAKRGYMYFSLTTVLLKTDLNGNPVGSVKKLAGHLGCITYDADRNCVYGALELKHDKIGAGIIARTGWDPNAEDNFYLVRFDCDAVTRMEMDAETDGVMQAVRLADVGADYAAVDEVSGQKHRYGCSGIDGTGYGSVFGDPNGDKKIMVCYGVYGDNERTDNDYQVILQYDPCIFETYGKPLNQTEPHHSGPETYQEKYFFYTGNTTYGVQNLEYDPFLQIWLVAVYTGNKPNFTNFPLFFIDGAVAATKQLLLGRNEELGNVLQSARLGKQGKTEGIWGSDFPYGATGVAAFGDGRYYFSQDGDDGNGGFYTNATLYRFINGETLFKKDE